LYFIGWETNEEKTGTFAMLKEEYIAGDLGFDPLGLRPALSSHYDSIGLSFVEIRNKELNNGRLAMVHSILLNYTVTSKLILMVL
jgi:hypothetical protein